MTDRQTLIRAAVASRVGDCAFQEGYGWCLTHQRHRGSQPLCPEMWDLVELSNEVTTAVLSDLRAQVAALTKTSGIKMPPPSSPDPLHLAYDMGLDSALDLIDSDG